MDEIDRILADFESRKRSERTDSESKDQQRRERSDRAERILSSVAVEALSEIASAVEAKGHRCEVRTPLSVADGSCVSLSIAASHPAASPSLLTICANTESDTVMIRKEVVGATGHGYVSEKESPIRELSEEKVREVATQFIRDVLEAN